MLLASCSSAPPPKPSLGVAWAGPSSLYLHSDLGVKSQTVATAKHGDRLEVLEVRRRFVHVRTASGVEGWTDANQLLSDRQMDELRLLAASAAQLPSQGTAKVYDALNIHVQPYRQSPSFFQIPEGGTVEVIGHRRSPHSPPPAPAKPVAVRRAPAKKGKSKAGSTATALRLPPPPPKPPAGWMEEPKPHPAAPAPAPPGTAPAPADDDWYLVRKSDGEVGWGLARMLAMNVPDDVAQYAEGHRVTAYLPLDEVQDKDKGETKQDWFWTTASPGLHPYDFDSIRVFVWSTKRHHYETAYIERNVKGYYPVQAEVLPGQDAKAFSIVEEDKDGKLYRQTFAFNGFHIRVVSKTPYQPPAPLPEVQTTTGFDPEAAPSAPPSASLSTQVYDWWKKVRGK